MEKLITAAVAVHNWKFPLLVPQKVLRVICRPFPRNIVDQWPSADHEMTRTNAKILCLHQTPGSFCEKAMYMPQREYLLPLNRIK